MASKQAVVTITYQDEVSQDTLDALESALWGEGVVEVDARFGPEQQA